MSEHLKLIGYPKNIQLSVFCNSIGGPIAFSVVSEILQWLIGRLEPETASSSSIGPYIADDRPLNLNTEGERVQFIRSVTEFFITKCGIKINPRKLYSSSFAAAKEILKVTRILLNAPQTEHQGDGGGGDGDTNEDEMEGSFQNLIELNESKVNELRRARELSSELTQHGAILYDLLKKEVSNKDIRNVHAGRSIELSTIERTLKTAINTLEGSLRQSKEKLEQIRLDKQNMISKVERKQSELERSRHRLEALKKVRPAYLDEFNTYEEELKQLFTAYILRVRCVDALKAQLNSSVHRTPTPTIILIVQPSDLSMSTLFANDELDSNESDDDDNVDDENAQDDSKFGKHVMTDRQLMINTRAKRAASAMKINRDAGRHVKIKENHSELDSSFNSDDEEEDSVLAELGGDTCT